MIFQDWPNITVCSKEDLDKAVRYGTCEGTVEYEDGELEIYKFCGAIYLIEGHDLVHSEREPE